MLTRIALVFALVAAITATAFAQESGFYFRSGKGLLFMGSDAPVVTDPEEPGQEDEDEPGEEDPGEEEPGDQDPESDHRPRTGPRFRQRCSSARNSGRR
jgi:hypothetical protein